MDFTNKSSALRVNGVSGHGLLIVMGDEQPHHLITHGDIEYFPADTRRWSDAGLLLNLCRRRWASIRPILGEYLLLTVFYCES